MINQNIIKELVYIYIIVMNSKQAEAIIEVLERLHNDAKLYNKVSVDYLRCAEAIKYVLDKVIEDFNSETMLYIFMHTNIKLNETLAPLDYTILKLLVEAGFVVTKVHDTVQYEKVK